MSHLAMLNSPCPPRMRESLSSCSRGPMLIEKAEGGVDPAEDVLGGEGGRMHRCTQLTPSGVVLPKGLRQGSGVTWVVLGWH